MKFPGIFLSILLILLVCQLGVPAAAAEAGEQVVIWTPEKNAAVSSAAKSGNRDAAAVTAQDGIPLGFSDAEVWTLEETADGWRFLFHDQALSMDAGSVNLKLDGVYDDWALEAGEEGLYRLKNVERGRYLSYSTSRGYWTTAASGTEVALYILPREEVPETPPAVGGYTLYFGQLHAHTDLSDGTGSVEEAFANASEVRGLDFFAVTDHSQSFDNAGSPSLMEDASKISQEWARGKAAAAAATNGEFVGLFGFEMTWNQGQGHLSTFNTPGFLSRDQETYQSYADGMEQYYAALLEAEGSVSQFNHPGDADGDFKDFAGYSPALDRRITLIEAGGGTESYDRALSKGWHLAPTNNQNTHGPWGAESGPRTVVLAEALTEQALLDAMADYRVYATEDGDLEIGYTLNGSLMGSRIPLEAVGETVKITADLNDPTDAAIGTVAVVTEEGTVLAENTLHSPRGSVSFTLPANRPYYYLSITQPDGDTAVTAPVWLDPRRDLGISSLKTAAEMTTAGEAQTFLLELYNEEDLPLEISSVSFTVENATYSAAFPDTLEPYTGFSCPFVHTFHTDGVFTVEAEVTGSFAGQVRSFREQIQVVVMLPPLVDDVIIDGTHGTLATFQSAMALAKDQDVDMHLETGEITEDMLKTCRLLVIPGPMEDLEGEFVGRIIDYVNRGGKLILCAASVNRDARTADRLNRLLEGLGLTLRANADEAVDPVYNSGSASELYTTVFADSPWLAELTEGQQYVQLSGCSVTGGTWLVKCMDGDMVVLAAEKTGTGGSVFLAGSDFLSDTHMEAIHGEWALPLGNQTILETILGLSHRQQPVISLADLRGAVRGGVYLAEGWVTAGTANPNTTFTDTIYIQDTTGAIAASGYSAHGLALGTRVRILGSLSEDGENPVLNILRLEVLRQEDVITPAEAGEAIQYASQGGQLLKLQGTVISAQLTADGIGVSRFVVEDARGNRESVLVEAYIRSGSRGKNELARILKPGNSVSAIGLVHRAQGETVLRLRDCDEVKLLWSPGWESTGPGADGDGETPGDPELPEDDGDGTGKEETDDGGTGGEEATEDADGGTADGDPDFNPNTGDRTGIGIYRTLALLSLLGMAAVKWKEFRTQAK